jgi:hypothetical protein
MADAGNLVEIMHFKGILSGKIFEGKTHLSNKQWAAQVYKMLQ